MGKVKSGLELDQYEQNLEIRLEVVGGGGRELSIPVRKHRIPRGSIFQVQLWHETRSQS